MEYISAEIQPMYYLKAQHLLVDLTQEYNEVYRIWWELSIPLEFIAVQSGSNVFTDHKFHEGHFNKAIDRAPLEQKKQMITKYEHYCE